MSHGSYQHLYGWGWGGAIVHLGQQKTRWKLGDLLEMITSDFKHDRQGLLACKE